MEEDELFIPSPSWHINPAPTHNFELQMGDGDYIVFDFFVKKTLLNRIKYWLFCQFFPFKIKRWDKGG